MKKDKKTKVEYINPYKEFYGLSIPNFLAVRPEVSMGAKVCYGRLAQYAGSKGFAFPKIATLAREIGIASRQTRNLLKELRDCGLIDITTRRKVLKSSIYKFLRHPWMFEDLSGAAKRRPQAEDCLSLPELILFETQGEGEDPEENQLDAELEEELTEEELEAPSGNLLPEVQIDAAIDCLTLRQSIAEPEAIDCLTLRQSSAGENRFTESHHRRNQESKITKDPASRCESGFVVLGSEENGSPDPDPEPESDTTPESASDPDKKRKIALKDKKRAGWLDRLAEGEPTGGKQRARVEPVVVPREDALAGMREQIEALALAGAKKREEALKKASIDKQRVKNLSGSIKTKDQKVINNSLFVTWEALMKETYPDTFVPKWSHREQKVSSELMEMGYTVGQIEQTMQYCVRYWDSIMANMGKKGPITYAAIRNLHEKLFREAAVADKAYTAIEEYKKWAQANPNSMNEPKELRARYKAAKESLEKLGIKI